MLKDFFPFPTIREAQDRVLTAMDPIIARHRHVIVESPVGSGKSGMGITFARHGGSSFLLTPRKSLQDQYFDDFSEHVVTLKGRSAYPCVDPSRWHNALPVRQIHDEVLEGNVSPRFLTGALCSNGRCMNSSQEDGRRNYQETCERLAGIPCPYQTAVETALEADHVVCNLHSFIYQTTYAGRFERRSRLVVDECHDMAGIIRDTLAKTVFFRGIQLEERPEMRRWDIPAWQNYFRHPANQPVGRFSREFRDYLNELEDIIDGLPDAIYGAFAVDIENKETGTSFMFRQLDVSRPARSMILDHGDRVLLMSGTIFSKNLFCYENGLDPAETAFLRVNSTFPVENRLVFYERNSVNMGAANWDNNFGHLIDRIRRILNRHDSEKGLIHAPSYVKAAQIAEAIGGRAVTHSSEDFIATLNGFFRTRDNSVFVSPICQQGTDFKDDRARFQICTTVPYLNVGDNVVAKMMERSPAWYDLKTLVIFAQMLGRPVRSETDHGVTYLLDNRFPGFLNRTRQWIPRWLMDSFRGF
jgi:Type III restriction enzyme, res subunit.